MVSRLFHTSDIELLDYILRDGYYVYEEDHKEFRLLENLKKYNLVDYEVLTYCKCYNENDNDYVDNEHGETCTGELIITEEIEEKGYGCATCDRIIDLDDKNEFFRKYKVIIKYKSIVNFLKKLLEEGGFTCRWSGSEGVFHCMYEEKDFILAIYEMCTNDFILSNAELDSSIIYLSIGPLPTDEMDIFNEWKYLTLAQVLCDEKGKNLKERIIFVTNTLTNAIPQKAILDFEVFLRKIKSGHLFEDFIAYFFMILKSRSSKLENYLAFLRKNQNNLIGSKTIKIGGAGNPDFIQFQKFKYIEAGLKSEKSGEIKRYTSANLDEGQFWKIIGKHAMEKEDVLIITTQEKISPSIWLAIRKFYLDNDHQWKHVIWDRWTLLDIMYHTGTLFLLKEWDEEYSCVITKDRFNREIRMTRERLNHIFMTPPEVKKFENVISDVLRDPCILKRSVYDEEVVLYYKYFEPIKKYITVAVKINVDSFVLTSYITDRIKEGDIIWKKR